MIAFEQGWIVWLALPWLLFWWAFARVQKRSLRWVDANVSDRFRRALTVHGARSLKWHLRLLLAAGLLLIAAGTRPTTAGRAELVPQGGRVLLLFDASASMNANDVEGFSAEGEDLPSRFETSRALAFELVHSLEDVRFGVASFSGVATVHLPVTGDRALLEESLRTLFLHNFYQSTGSSFTFALDTVLKYVDAESPDLQVVFLSDGEPPFEEDYDDALQALVEREIPVHTVAIGSLEGQERLIYDFRDVVAGKEERAVLREFHTRRVDRHLQRMSEATGGRFSVAVPGVVEELAATIRTQPVPRGRVEEESARTDLSRVPLAAFLVCFLLDAVVVGDDPPPPPPPPDGEDPQQPPPPPPPGSPPPSGQDPNQGEPPPSSPPPPAPPQLTGEELEEIGQALARISEQKQEEGKYFRQPVPSSSARTAGRIRRRSSGGSPG